MFDLDLIDAHLRAHPRALVCIDGPAGAGKTTLAQQIVELRADAVVVHMDDLYDGWVNALDERLTERLISQIRDPFLHELPVEYSRYDWYAGEFTETVSLPRSPLLVVEGVASAQRAMREVAALSIFIDVDPDVGRERVLLRDGALSADHIEAWQSQEQAHFAADGTRTGVTLTFRS